MQPVTQLLGHLQEVGNLFSGVISIPTFLSKVLGMVLIAGGVVVFLCLLWGGFQWLTSGDDQSNLQKARERLTQCLIGFAVLALSYAIAILVQYFLGIEIFEGFGTGGGPTPTPPPEVTVPPGPGPTTPPGSLTPCDPDDPSACGQCEVCNPYGGVGEYACQAKDPGNPCTLECWSSAACGSGGQCEPSGDNPTYLCGGYDCTTDPSVCDGYGVCDPDTGTCVSSCVVSGCTDPEVCDPDTGLCIEPVPPTSTPTPTPTTMVTPEPSPEPGLILYYSFDNESDSNVFDMSGYNYHTSLLDPTGDTWINGGCGGQALSIDGRNRTFISPSGTDGGDFDVTDFTIAAWVRPRTQSGSYNLVIDGRSTFIINLDSQNRPQGLIHRGGGYDYLNASNPLPVGQWSHVALTYSDTDGMARLYVNGVSVVSRATGPPIGHICYVGVGMDCRGVSDGADITGDLDEIRVYNRALSASEVSGLANSCTPN